MTEKPRCPAPVLAAFLACLATLLAGWGQSSPAPEKTGSKPASRTAEADRPSRPLEFHVSFTGKVRPGPFTGRVFVMLSKNPIKDLPQNPKWFNTDPFFAQDVKDWQPGTCLEIGRQALAFPQPLAKLCRGTYSLQAVLDLDQGYQSCIASPGNGYSQPIRLEADPTRAGPIKLVIDQVYPAEKFQETERVKLVEKESKLLSSFHGRPIKLRAGVVLPKSFAGNPGKRYPVVYEIPGFGGTHRMAHGAASRQANDVAGVEMLYVVLDPACRLGHHVFADSANNGPCGRALLQELIPYLESTYRGLGVPGARFVTGHSSGGWSSLWLQVSYPDFFGGAWSTAPDPVDFRDFQGVNIYTPGTNLFFDEKGKPRPLARRAGKVTLHYKTFSDMEKVMGHGGQLESFEAVFSPRGPEGKPRQLWDRRTGRIDSEVARAWQSYDIRLILQNHWKTLGPKLAGKLHLFMGAQDNYYLEGATLLLQKTLAGLGSDAVVEIFPGRDHGSLLDPKLRQRIATEMARQFRKAKIQN